MDGRISHARAGGGGASLRSLALVACGVVLFSQSAAADPRAVVELFTSQGCSSCPPADKLLGELTNDPSLIALSLPIDYWDYLGWKDTLADKRFTARQKAYSHMRGDREVYTPQVVINGKLHAVGSDRGSIERAIEQTSKEAGVMSVPVSLTVTKGQLNVAVSSAPSAPVRGEIWLWSVAREVPIAIGRGENHGREITYHNVVRNWLKIADWSGKPGTWSIPMENVLRDGVDGAIVYVQDGDRDRPGAMLGAAHTALH